MADGAGGCESVGDDGDGGDEEETLCKGHAEVGRKRKKKRGVIKKEGNGRRGQRVEYPKTEVTQLKSITAVYYCLPRC